MFALAIWIGASTFWASDRFAASIEATHWIAAMILLWSTSQLVRSWAPLRLIAGVCFGVLLVLTAHGAVYRFVDVPDERTSFLQNEQRIYQERGWAPDSFIARQFKRKVLAGEIIGFSASPNTYAMELVLLSVIAAGMIAQRIADRDEWGWQTGIGFSFVPVLLMLWLTQCRAALATPIFAAGIAGVAALKMGSRLRPSWSRRSWFWTINAVILAGIAAMILYGKTHGSLVHDSLTFRWRYWIGAIRMLADHFVRGVGFGNFGDFYLAVRLPIASEEIRDPHNFFVRILTETGVVGATLLLCWLLRMAWEMTAPVRSQPASSSNAKRISPLLPLFLLALITMVVNTLVSVDLSQTLPYVSIEILKRLLWTGLLTIGLLVGCVHSTDDQTIDERPAPWILLTILASLAAFLLHNTIEFGLFESGPLGLFAMLCGAALGMSPDATERQGNWIVAGASVLGWGGMLAFWTVPIVQGETLAQSADDELQTNRPDQAVQIYGRAAETLPVADAQLFLKTATAKMYGQAAPSSVLESLNAATSNNSKLIRGALVRAEYELRLPFPDAAMIRRDYEHAISLNPNDVGVRTDYGHALERLGDPTAAASAYQAALDANAGLSNEEPKRLPLDQVQQLSERIRQLRR